MCKTSPQIMWLMVHVVALGKRNLLWDLLLDALEPNVLEVRHAE